jgi:hypothetical protein
MGNPYICSIQESHRREDLRRFKSVLQYYSKDLFKLAKVRLLSLRSFPKSSQQNISDSNSKKSPFFEEQIHDLNLISILGGLSNAESQLHQAYRIINN